jgi:hypothetical protein
MQMMGGSELFMASEFEKPDASRFMPNCFVVGPLSNLLLPLSPVQLSGAHFLFSLQGSASFQHSGAHFLFSLLAPTFCSILCQLIRYKICSGIRFRFVISFQSRICLLISQCYTAGSSGFHNLAE